MAKILITGIGGFTGRYLASELVARGHEVCGIAHRPMPESAFRVHACDLFDSDRLTDILAAEQPEVLVHLAAIAFVAHGDAGSVYQTNIVGTRNVLHAIDVSDTQPQSVIVASSANVYGNATEGVIDEQVMPAPANDYAVSKLAMEYVAKLWEGRLPITVVRPFNYTGVGQAHNFLIPKIVSHFQDRAPVIELGNLHVVRDFSDVRDVVRAYAAVLEGNHAGQTFNVCSGVGTSLQDVLAMASDITGHHPEVRVNPAFVRGNEVHKLIGSNVRLQQAIGPIQPIALRDTLEWMLEQRW
ncbi:NAD-dependent epimerase/dehydratase family protein [Burkholderia sp. TSV86]|uniref:NAD-dependent epimerase/dehydratase family protein n=1 Tax=Burkholderia sp. TSV86 TaxID=1385594 RepID=UPI00075E93D2|nr:NAD-dependent epimerase/dehydratase family protein [Burkholderia sp. TSV86]KVE35386.1 GDP-mannose 4,6 dehydratase [Burkholderia sp. TSV86]